MANVGDVDIELDLAAIRKAAEDGPVSSRPSEPALVPREKSYSLKYTTPEGEKLRGSVTSRVLDAKGRRIYDRTLAHLAASIGTTWGFIAMETALAIRARARVVSQLVDPPAWVLAACEHDNDLLFRIADALEVHEAAYFRRDTQAGAAPAGEPRVVLDAIEAS